MAAPTLRPQGPGRAGHRRVERAGRALRRGAGREGAAVALVARRAERLAAVKARIEAAGGRAVAIGADVLDRQAMTRAFDAGRDRRSAPSPSWSTMPASRMPIARSICPRRSGGGWSAPISTPCSSGRRRRRAACWPPSKGGAIVNIASVLGFGVSKGTAAYAVAKAGVIQLTKALGLELAFKGVRVNAIAPGWIVTDLNRDYLTSEQGAAIKREIPVGRFGEDARSRRRAAAARLRRRPLHGRHHHRGRRRPDGGATG